MRSLLDAGVLIALFDPKHIFHSKGHSWLANNYKEGWASCPLTENAVVRIMSNPKYDQLTLFSIKQVVALLNELIERTDHQFWPDDVSILDDSLFAADRIHGPRQITDLYLLALAVKRGGRLVTFDERIPLSAVKGADPSHLCIA